MTIDERLEKLAERHEALTHSVELMSRDLYTFQEKNEKAVADLTAQVVDLTAQVADVTSQVAYVTVQIAHTNSNVDKLVRKMDLLAELSFRHEDDLHRLEKRLDDLEGRAQ